MVNSETRVFNVSNNLVVIEFIFLKEFSEKDYYKAFKEFVKIQRKILKIDPRPIVGGEENIQRLIMSVMPEISTKVLENKKLLNEKEIENVTHYPSFDYFKKTCIDFLCKILLETFKTMPELMLTNQRCYQIRIFNGYKRGYIGEQMELISGYVKYNKVPIYGNVYLHISGELLISRIVAPWYFINKIDYSNIYKFFVHELRHHLESIRGAYEREYKITGYEWNGGKIQQLMEEKPELMIKGIARLYTAFNDTYTEGVANFIEKTYQQRIEIRKDYIQNFRKYLEKLILYTYEKSASDFYGAYIDNNTFGTHYNGRIMCLFIALALQKKKKLPLNVIIGNERKAVDFRDLNNIISKNPFFYIEKIDAESLQEAYAILNNPKVRFFKRFLVLYEEACNELGISENTRILTMRLFRDLRKKAFRNYDEIKKRFERELDNNPTEI